MDEIMELQDEALLYLRDNITKDEAYYILTTDKEMLAILIADKKDGSKRIKVFTGQLIQLAKAYGEKRVIKYQKEEEEVCQDTIETQ